MRQIGHLPSEDQAHRFADFLLTLGVHAHTEEDGDGWALWVREENHFELAKAEFKVYLSEPDDARYRDASRQADTLRHEATKKREQARKNTIQMRQQWNRPLARRAPLVMTLIVLSVIVAIASNFGGATSGSIMRSLAFVDYGIPTLGGEAWRDIRQGQVWRVITPIFIHYGPMHLVFNMICLYYFGTRIESRRGTLRLAALVLATAVISNVAQAVAVGPAFGGMSGVVYGLFGYIWMKMLFEPSAGLAVNREVVIFVMAWLLLGFSGQLALWFGINVANWAHGGGIAAGAAIGCAPVLLGSKKTR